MMAPKAPKDDILQQYHDGELPGAERLELEAQLVDQPELAAALTQLGKLGSLMREVSAGPSAKLDSDALFGRIDAAIKAGEQVATDPPLAAGSEGEAAASTVGAGRAALHVVAGGRKPRRAVLAAGVGAVLATAAALTLVWTSGHQGNSAAMRAATGTTPRGSEVMEVDFGSTTGTVFAVEGEVGEPIAVVWIND